MTVLEKQNIISAICHKTQKEAQAILAEFHPVASLPKSREKQITTNHTQIQILINQETNQKLQELKSLYSHQIPDGDLNQLFSLIIDIAIEKHPLSRNKNSITKQPADNSSTKYQSTQQDDQSNQNLPFVDSNDFQIKNDAEFNRKSKAKSEGENDNIAIKIQTQSKYYPRKSLPISAKRIIFTRAQGQCEYRSPNGQRCHSQHQLEYDHIQSVSHGGTNSVDNLQLLCRQHNQFKVQMTHGFIYLK